MLVLMVGYEAPGEEKQHSHMNSESMTFSVTHSVHTLSGQPGNTGNGGLEIVIVCHSGRLSMNASQNVIKAILKYILIMLGMQGYTARSIHI